MVLRPQGRTSLVRTLVLHIALPALAVETPVQAVQRLTAVPMRQRPGVAKSGGESGSGVLLAVPTDIVEVQVFLEQMKPIEMLEQSFGFEGYLRAWWTDERLKYDPATAPQLKLSPTDSNQLWKPKFYWERAKEIVLPMPDRPDLGESFWVYPDGKVFWSRQTVFVLGCNFAGKKLDKFPFDQQNCTITMGMYSDTADEVFLKWKEDAVALENWQGACLAEFHTVALHQESQYFKYTVGEYTYATATMTFARAPNTWLFTYFMPAVALVAVSYLGFFIDPDQTPARVTLGLVTLLIVMTNFISLTSRLPATVNPSWLSRFVLMSFVFNLVAMFEQVLVSFGKNIKKWLDVQRQEIEKIAPWAERLATVNRKVLLQELKVVQNNGVSAKKFRHVLASLGMEGVPAADILELYHQFSDSITRDQILSPEELNAMLDHVEKKLEESQPKANGSPGEKRRVCLAPFSQSGGKSLVVGLPPRPQVQMGGEGSEGVDDAKVMGAGDVEQPTGLRQRAHATRDPFTPVANVGSIRVVDDTGLAPPITAYQRFAMRAAFRTAAMKALGNDRGWVLKTFILFPVLQNLRYLDFIFRVAFPIAYYIFITSYMFEIGFGDGHYATLETAPCFLESQSA